MTTHLLNDYRASFYVRRSYGNTSESYDISAYTEDEVRSFIASHHPNIIAGTLSIVVEGLS